MSRKDADQLVRDLRAHFAETNSPYSDVVDEAPEMGVYLLARLRMFIVSSWFEPDEGDAGTPAVAS